MKRFILTLALGLAAVGGAVAQQSASQQSVRVVPVPDPDLSVRIWTDQETYNVGEYIRISYRATQNAYVLIFTTDPRGETRQLLPNSYDDDNYVRAGQTYTIPNRGYRLEVTPPSGRETISIVAFKDRNQALDAYRTRKSEAFPKSDGPRAAIARVRPVPDNSGRQRYAEDSTTIRVVGRSDNNNGGGHHGDRGDYGRLSVNSNPGGAYVYLNSQYRGVTPLDLGRVREGSYDLVINRPGYYPVRKRIRVQEDERTRISENLRPVRYY